MFNATDQEITEECIDQVTKAVKWTTEQHAVLCEKLAEALGDCPEHSFAKQMLSVAALSIRLQS